MKNTLFILFLSLFSQSIFGQEQQLYNVRSIHEMPVFPHCENIKSTQKKKATQCISQQLTQLLSNKLQDFETFMSAHGITESQAKLRFIITKEGVIVNVEEVKGSDPALAEAAVEALNQIAEELPPILPGKLSSGEKVNLLFEVPLRFIVEPSINSVDPLDYPVDEIVLFTLLEKDFRYEIRLFKGKNIKVYEVKDKQETFLGKFLSLQEVGQSDPYKTLIQNEKGAELTFITDGYLDEDFYQIYIRHLFDQNKNAFIEIYQVKEAQQTKIAEFQNEIDFNRSRYAPLIYRE